MSNTKERILEILKEDKGLTVAELSSRLGKAQSGIRGRLSELNKAGYNIRNISGRYTLKQDSAQKILQWVNQTGSYNIRIEYDVLAKKLGLSNEQVEEAMFIIYKQGRLLQESNTAARILR